MTGSTDDIKDLLGRALGGQEPPLRLDRDEVFRVGRKRLRRRRALEAGGVVAAVVVVVVGATTLTGLGDGDSQRLLPAATSTATVTTTQGKPELPVSTTVHGPPSAPVSQGPITSEHADVLTDKLYNSAVLHSRDLTTPGPAGKPEFVVRGGTYLFEADVTFAGMEGALQVTVESGPLDRSVTCEDMSYPGDCEVRLRPDYKAPVATSDWATGKVVRREVRTLLPDGTKVMALVTNQSSRQLADNPPSMSPNPPLSLDDLVELVLNCGLRVS